MPKYRVTNSRYDTLEEKHYFDANNDVKAKEIFNKEFKSNSNYDWDCLHLYKIVQEEKILLLDMRK